MIFVDEASWFSKIQFIPHPNRENVVFTILVISFREKFLFYRVNKDFISEA